MKKIPLLFIIILVILGYIAIFIFGFYTGELSANFDIRKNNEEFNQVISELNKEINECNHNKSICDGFSIREADDKEEGESQPNEEEISSKLQSNLNTDREAIPDALEYTTEDLEFYIRLIAKEYGVNEDLALSIAQCESYPALYNTCHCAKGNPANNTCVESCYQGIGIYKITPNTAKDIRRWMSWESFDPYEPFDNIRGAMYLISKGYLLKWKQSAECWHPAYK